MDLKLCIQKDIERGKGAVEAGPLGGEPAHSDAESKQLPA